MKARTAETMVRQYLLPRLEGFTCKGSLLFKTPIGYLLRGFCFESSSFDPNSFYVSVFVQPLYVPSDCVYFNFGKRLYSQRGDPWVLQKETAGQTMADVLASIQAQGLPFLAPIRTPADLGTKPALVAGDLKSPLILEAVAYSLILAHRTADALQALGRLESTLADDDDPDWEWAGEYQERLRRVRSELVRDPAEAIALLDAWTAETKTALRLPED